jgi:lysyl-tRNA synthetase class 1
LVLQHYDEIMGIMLPTLREERRATYSPFAYYQTGHVLQVPMVEVNLQADSVVYRDPRNNEYELTEVQVLGGKCKLQWKVDGECAGERLV